MDRLITLQRECEENTKNLGRSRNLQDRLQLMERRKAIREEAQLLADSMDVEGPCWISA